MVFINPGGIMETVPALGLAITIMAAADPLNFSSRPSFFLGPDNAFVGYETDYAVIDNVLSLRP